MTDEELYELRTKVYHELLKYDVEDQCQGQMDFAIGCGKDELVFTKLYEYLLDPNTSKTRNDIAEFILEFDDEFQNRNNDVESIAF